VAAALVIGVGVGGAACAPATPDEIDSAPGGSASGASGSAAALASAGTGIAGSVSSSGAPQQAGGASGADLGGQGGIGGESVAGASATMGGAGASGASSTAGAAGTPSAGAPAIPSGCEVSTPVSFKNDIAPFLGASCGKGQGGGCHVTDSASTANSLCPDGTKACGFNHAYDWITAGSHNEFCQQPSTPIRYTVVMAVLDGANPATCTKTRIMPPDGPPATACQKAALAAWLAEPKVLQLHRADDTSPSEPYLMPPFN
jgi:hypothetical protein